MAKVELTSFIDEPGEIDEAGRSETGPSYTLQKTAALLKAAESLAGAQAGEAEQYGDILLHHPPPCADRLGGRSDLNLNGSPLQLLVSSRPQGREARLIGDPAFFHVDPLTRFQESIGALDATLRAGGAWPLRELCWRSINSTLPVGPEALRTYETGMIRLAIALSGAGAAMYVGAEPDSRAAWRKAREWLTAILPAPRQALVAMAALEPQARVFGVGLEGRSLADGRAKFYWRLLRPTSPEGLAGFGVELFERRTIGEFLSLIIGGKRLPSNAVTFSAGFHLATGELTDIKADVCVESAKLSRSDAIELAASQTERLGLAPTPFRELDSAISIGCLGLGLDHRRRHRLNVYLFQE